MLSLQYTLMGFLDSLTGHLMFVSYLLAVTDEHAVWNRLKKLPMLLLSPLIVISLSLGPYDFLEWKVLRYFMASLLVFVMCTLWVMWAWRWNFWRAFSATCMAAILQVASSAVAQILFMLFPYGLALEMAAVAAVLVFSVTAAILLKRLRFGAWFRLLLEDEVNQRRTAVLVFALEVSMEIFLILQNGVQEHYLAAYYILVVVLVFVIIGLIVYLARRLDDSRTLQIQQDVIAQQQLYEQSLEDVRLEMRYFRHDYKNLLESLSLQAGEGELNALRATLAELGAGFDRQLEEKIQLSVQMGNLRVPQVRSLLLSKLTDMRNRDVKYRLEVLYPVETVSINVWDFVRCLGILVDNAIEAALDAERPWVEIILLVQGRRVCLRVSNPYTNVIEPEKMWEDGWSTKGAGRGLGLPGYQRILENYSNVSACTSWDNGVFVQEMTVEDRS